MGKDFNQNWQQNRNNGQKQTNYIKAPLCPIPVNQQNLLKERGCNFSLYSPRMVCWMQEGGELKSDKDAVSKLREVSEKSFQSSEVSKELEKKQKLQSEYLASLKEDGIQTFTITAKTSSPFITGLGSGHPTETGMILDRNLGVPYIPSSSIKGVLRLAYAVNIADGRNEVPDSELEKYFGSTDTNKSKPGQLMFLEAYPKGRVELKLDIMNPHFSNYYSGKGNIQPVETESPNPIEFLTVKEGTEFVFNCAYLPFDQNDRSNENVKSDVKEMFKTAFTKIGFGGKTSIGYGRFEKLNNSTETSKIIKKENLVAGEYDAVVVNSDSNRSSIFFEIGKSKDKGVLRNCNAKILSSYKKRDKVRVKIGGTKNNIGDYVVVQILSKL